MFYVYTDGTSRTYWRDLEDAVRCGVKWQLKQSKPIQYVTVYEVGTDRIRYQYCERCDKATEWRWDPDEYDRFATLANPVVRAVKGRAGEAFCSECGERVAVRNVQLDGSGNPMEQMALLFELMHNRAFQPSVVMDKIMKIRNWENMTLKDMGRRYIRELEGRGVRFTSTPVHLTRDQEQIMYIKVKTLMYASRKTEMQTRVMDMNALEGPK